MAIKTYGCVCAINRDGTIRTYGHPDKFGGDCPFIDFGIGMEWVDNPEGAKKWANAMWAYVEVKWDTEKEEVVE